MINLHSRDGYTDIFIYEKILYSIRWGKNTSAAIQFLLPQIKM